VGDFYLKNMCKRKKFLSKKLCNHFKKESFYIVDVLSEFKEIRFKYIKKAINYNLKGLHKSEKISTQILCLWIRNYIEFVNNNKSKL
jgi:hypothetical protein